MEEELKQEENMNQEEAENSENESEGLKTSSARLKKSLQAES